MVSDAFGMFRMSLRNVSDAWIVSDVCQFPPRAKWLVELNVYFPNLMRSHFLLFYISLFNVICFDHEESPVVVSVTRNLPWNIPCRSENRLVMFSSVLSLMQP